MNRENNSVIAIYELEHAHDDSDKIREDFDDEESLSDEDLKEIAGEERFEREREEEIRGEIIDEAFEEEN